MSELLRTLHTQLISISCSQDPLQAEALLGASLVRSTVNSPEFAGPDNTEVVGPSQSLNFNASSSRMDVDELGPRHAEPATPTVGTPIKLAPSASAFRRPGTGAPVTPAALQPTALAPASASGAQQSPSKGMLGQVSDLLFGW